MSTKNITIAARLIDSETPNCSQYGNPRAKLWLELADGSHVIARTATDAATGYCVDNWCDAKALGCPWGLIDYHVTRCGSVIVDQIGIGVGDFTVLADDTDMARGGILTNDCKPVENAKGE